MTVFLEGVGAQFYRGIGSEIQLIAPFSRMNFFIGANNSGKSIVLNLIASQLKQGLSGRPSSPLRGPEVYRGEPTGEFKLLVGRNVEALVENVYKGELTDRLNKTLQDNGSFVSAEQTFNDVYSANAKDGVAWVHFKKQGRELLFPPVDESAARSWTKLWRPLCYVLRGF